ncbi:hypothetical protein VPNG_06952 [Cytospora leucostoma]|uniref:Kinetochore protein fta4 n=1 Tax=Cytospora leucostoma TaxID=1230097 RepID=A0A423WXF3_9PEZI|nr:hypothetical protein VPNG_06952 [Cytospora leucostoma]
MAPNPAPTIPTLKQNFLTAQTRLLSQPLQPSRAWRRANDSAGGDGGAVTEKAVDDALLRLNHTIQQHARRVYAPQATRHVAEQIDALYLSTTTTTTRSGAGAGGEGVKDDDDEEEEEEGWRNVGADYADDKVASSLPPTWGSVSAREEGAHPLEAERYAELAGRVQGLAARRRGVEARVARLRRIRGLVAPFEGVPSDGTNDRDQDAAAGGGGGGGGGGVGGVQENLVTRDGEVERELERMRMLLVRVGDKVGRLQGGRDGEGEVEDLFGDGDAMVVDDVEVEERRKVEGLLDALV